jgi:hypothetical protein
MYGLKPVPTSRALVLGGLSRSGFGKFLKFDIFGSFLGLVAQRRRVKGFISW